MEQHCVKHTELPGASRLFADFIYRFDRVQQFYSYPPYDPESLTRAAAAILYPASRRAAVAAALRKQNPGNPSVDLLEQPDTLAVVTGQQVGLFGGPLYTFFKAMAAARLARTLSERGQPAVPVFWLATEDHDLAEINKAWVFDAGQRPVSLSTAASNRSNGPVGPIELRDIPLSELRETLRGMPFAGEVMDLAASAYCEGASFGSAFRRLAEEILKPFGIVFLDPLEPEIRQIAAPFLSRALAHSRELVEEVRERSRELEAAGYHAQVHLEPNASLLFRLDRGQRVVLKRTEKGFNDFTLEELLRNPEALSPNAILRPVMQDYLLPTVAYLGGPAELAYFAQSEPLYRRLLGRMPVVSHRASFTLLDRRGEKLMERFRLSLKDVAVPEFNLRETVASRSMSSDLADRFRSARLNVETELARLTGSLDGFDSGLSKALARSRRKILYQLEKMESKAAREGLRRDAQASTDADYLYNLIYPHRHLQERMYGILPFLARHGMDLPSRVFECVRPECPDHQVLCVD